MVPRHFLLLFFILFGFSCFQAQARFITGRPSPTDLVSDGISTVKSPPYLLLLKPLASAEVSCEQTYGFLPCSTTALGNLFLILVYGYLMYLAATYLSNGSEVLHVIRGPGIVGGLSLPPLGALPNAMLILVSGLSGAPETAQSQVSVGMGMLAGSTIMFLTVVWGSCVAVGRCDLRDSVAVDGTITKGFSLTETGVSTDIWTCYAARIMAISVIPFIIVQVSQILNSTLGRRLAVLIALIVSLSLLVSYCLYQMCENELFSAFIGLSGKAQPVFFTLRLYNLSF
ncbi:hypothetical protein QUC31_002192 [Theobroma cacao]